MSESPAITYRTNAVPDDPEAQLMVALLSMFSMNRHVPPEARVRVLEYILAREREKTGFDVLMRERAP